MENKKTVIQNKFLSYKFYLVKNKKLKYIYLDFFLRNRGYEIGTTKLLYAILYT